MFSGEPGEPNAGTDIKVTQKKVPICIIYARVRILFIFYVSSVFIGQSELPSDFPGTAVTYTWQLGESAEQAIGVIADSLSCNLNLEREYRDWKNNRIKIFSAKMFG